MTRCLEETEGFRLGKTRSACKCVGERLFLTVDWGWFSPSFILRWAMPLE